MNEDIIAFVDGRPELVDELRRASDDLQQFIAHSCRRLLSEPRFLDALLGYLLPDPASQARLDPLLERLQSLSDL